MSNAPSLNEDDIRQQVKTACRALEDLAEIVIAVALNGVTSADLASVKPRLANGRRIRAEETFNEARSVFVDALLGTVSAGRYVGPDVLARALDGRIEANDIAAGLRPACPLRTAMRRVDDAERAERQAIASAHSLGESICAAIGLDLPLTLRGSL